MALDDLTTKKTSVLLRGGCVPSAYCSSKGELP